MQLVKQTDWFKRSNISPREEEVFDLLLKGLCNKKIASVLGCTERTVKAHTNSVFTKLGSSDRSTFYADVIETLVELNSNINQN